LGGFFDITSTILRPLWCLNLPVDVIIARD
jgi:hypothetical protein